MMLISKPIKCKCNVKKCKNVNVKKKIDLIHINVKIIVNVNVKKIR